MGYPPPTPVRVGAGKAAVYVVERVFLDFNTWSIPANATITRAYLDLTILGSQQTGTPYAPAIYITQGVQQLPVITTDFGDQLAENTIGAIGTIDNSGGFNNHHYEFLQPGLAFIRPRGTTLLCLRGQYDLANITPGSGHWSLLFYPAQGGAAVAPTLTVEYLSP